MLKTPMAVRNTLLSWLEKYGKETNQKITQSNHQNCIFPSTSSNLKLIHVIDLSFNNSVGSLGAVSTVVGC